MLVTPDGYTGDAVPKDGRPEEGKVAGLVCRAALLLEVGGGDGARQPGAALVQQDDAEMGDGRLDPSRGVSGAGGLKARSTWQRHTGSWSAGGQASFMGTFDCSVQVIRRVRRVHSHA